MYTLSDISYQNSSFDIIYHSILLIILCNLSFDVNLVNQMISVITHWVFVSIIFIIFIFIIFIGYLCQSYISQLFHNPDNREI